MPIHQHYVPVIVFLIIGVLFPLAAMFISWIVRKNNPYSDKLTTYECGEIPIGQAHTQFDVFYYLFAIVFLFFDVETMLIFPWAVVFPNIGMLAVLEMILFIVILILGLVYAWKKGILEWRTWHEKIQIITRSYAA